ncbi:MAG: hypothetical protein IKO36_05235 [Bacteroidaceae bacterium]|nr:hypothetical protein [Bacteroidaceae bacterium]
MTEEKRLFQIAMGYWWECVTTGRKEDRLINDLLEDFVKAEGKPYFPDDLDRTVLNLSNSQKRYLIRQMVKSGIITATMEDIISEYCQ